MMGLVASLYGVMSSCSVKPEKRADPQKVKPETAEINELPDIILLDQNGKQYSARSLAGNTLLIFFGATCDHCQREATQIHKNLRAFDRYTLYFIALDPFPLINKFAEDYQINNQPNIHFARADGTTVFNSLGNIQTPTILIYAANRKLIKRFDGETKVEEILKLL